MDKYTEEEKIIRSNIYNPGKMGQEEETKTAPELGRFETAAMEAREANEALMKSGGIQEMKTPDMPQVNEKIQANVTTEAVALPTSESVDTDEDIVSLIF